MKANDIKQIEMVQYVFATSYKLALSKYGKYRVVCNAS